MRIWDLSPGYLNRQSLLGEHRELHGIVAIIRDNKKGYFRHPETLRWVGHGWALRQRHKLLAAEMKLRAYVDKSPVLLRSNPAVWPETYIDPPATQITLLRKKYAALEHGRIPLPKNAQQLWAQHKYSVMARDNRAYKALGKWVAVKSGVKNMSDIALRVTTLLRKPPQPGLVENSLLHMWGYVSRYTSVSGDELGAMSAKTLLSTIQQLALANHVKYLLESTALSELDAWAI